MHCIYSSKEEENIFDFHFASYLKPGLDFIVKNLYNKMSSLFIGSSATDLGETS